MAHQMGMAKINMTSATSGSVVETITYSGNSATPAYNNTTTTSYYPALNYFTGNIPYNYSTTVSYFVVKPNTQYLFSTLYTNASGTAQWTIADGTNGVKGVAASDITTGGIMKSLNTTVPAFKNIARVYSYSGQVQAYTPLLANKKYKMECWGAKGGNGYTTNYAYTGNFTPVGGKGGYSTGFKQLDNTTIYVVVGGTGENGQFRNYRLSAGGYNGGGNGGYNNVQSEGDNYGRCGAGGGATHIGKKNGLLTTYNSDYSTQLFLVAGGGGGASVGATGRNYDGYGGGGGGATGLRGGICEHPDNTDGYGGGQSGARQIFGQGETSTCSTGGNNGGECPGGGGGGGFYGGNQGHFGRTVYGSGGGGGSGYIGGVDSPKETKAGNQSFAVPTAATGTETGHNDSGYARITCMPYQE